MQIEKIYFDMDGVLADFDRGVEELAGIQKVKQGNDSPGADDTLWEAVRKVDRFYDRLEPIPGAIELFNTLYQRYGDKCEILSAIPKPHRNILTAKEDKLTWVKRLLPDGVVANIVYRAEKQEFAKSRGHILIDDYQINIDEWEQSGGSGILFENPESVLSQVKELENQ